MGRPIYKGPIAPGALVDSLKPTTARNFPRFGVADFGGRAFNPLDPSFIASTDMRAAWIAGSTGETYSGSNVLTSPDLSGRGNTLVAPSIVGKVGPVLDATAARGGRPAWVFDGSTTGLIRSSFSWGTARGPLSVVLFCRRRVVTASQRLFGYQADRPFISTNGQDALSWAADGAFSTSGTVEVNGTFGYVAMIGTFDPDVDEQQFYQDAVSLGITANTDPGSTMEAGSVGLGYSGHPSTWANAFEGEIAACFVHRYRLTDAHVALYQAWFARQYPAPARGPILLGNYGQSNEQADQSTSFARNVTRTDIYAIRHGGSVSGDASEQQAWGPLNDTYLSGSLRGAEIECLYQLADDYLIKADLASCTRSGTGFRLSADGSLDPNGWASPSVYGGDGARQWTRMVAVTDEALVQRPNVSAIWALVGFKETDGLHATSAAAYEASLEAWISDYRARYETASRLVHIVLPLLNPGATSVTFNATIRAAQEAVIAAGTRVYGIDCDDQSIRVDWFHYEQPYHTALGGRWAAIIDAN